MSVLSLPVHAHGALLAVEGSLYSALHIREQLQFHTVGKLCQLYNVNS